MNTEQDRIKIKETFRSIYRYIISHPGKISSCNITKKRYDELVSKLDPFDVFAIQVEEIVADFLKKKGDYSPSLNQTTTTP